MNRTHHEPHCGYHSDEYPYDCACTREEKPGLLRRLFRRFRKEPPAVDAVEEVLSQPAIHRVPRHDPSPSVFRPPERPPAVAPARAAPTSAPSSVDDAVSRSIMFSALDSQTPTETSSRYSGGSCTPSVSVSDSSSSSSSSSGSDSSSGSCGGGGGE